MKEHLPILIFLMLGVAGLTNQVFGIMNHLSNDRVALKVAEWRYDLDTEGSRFLGICGTATFNEHVYIYEREGEDETIQGEFGSDGYVDIIIINTNVPNYTLINTVAHEVSHYVDRLVHVKGIEDTETRAYLQGHLTACVFDKVLGTRTIKEMYAEGVKFIED